MEAGQLVIRGFAVKFQFPNLSRLAFAEQCGLGEAFKDTWERLKKDQKGDEYKRIAAAWPEYIKRVVIDAPEWLQNIEELTGGEVMAIVVGFTVTGMEIRES